MDSTLRLASNNCPMCGRGHLNQMVLMDTLSCPLCQHIFSWDHRQKCLNVLDVSTPITWRWNGHRWQLGPYPIQPITAITIVFALLVIFLPSLMIEVASYIFPPLPGSPFEYFHVFWAITALMLHGGWVLWILAESYHFTPYTLAKIKIREFFASFHRQRT